ncbi:MAG: CaiB/BaiF CoA-transferase family protein [Alphaproteobacteria bacterium]
MGPLAGIKVVEIAGIGPGPFCSMLLADMGADVLRVDRTAPSGLGIASEPKYDVLTRGRRSVSIDLKQPAGVETVLRLADGADALIEGFRPGVAERLGIGPEVCQARNPKLVYGRMTGWGQDGPIAQSAGHDINYIALAGALAAIGRPGGPPSPPLNLVGDFGGGAMFLAFGLLAALIEAGKSGQGQVVDVSMVEGAAYLATPMFGMLARGYWSNERGTNILDSGAHFYDAYECKDGNAISIGSIEPKFYAELLEKTGLEGEELPKQMDRAQWPAMKRKLEAVFKTKTRDEWCEIMEGTDICFAPVLNFAEAPKHPHNIARGSFIEIEGVTQPAPAPKFSRTKPEVQRKPPRLGEHTREALADWGIPAADIDALIAKGAAVQSD